MFQQILDVKNKLLAPNKVPKCFLTFECSYCQLELLIPLNNPIVNMALLDGPLGLLFP